MSETMTLRPAARGLHGRIAVPGDKSISHRAVMLGALAEGDTHITGFLGGEDCLSTISCFTRLGIPITQQDGMVTVYGRGLHGLREYDGVLDAGNSGTTTRLLSGILAGQPFLSRLDGDASLRRRPMGRVALPLSEMGAGFTLTEGCCPMTICGGALRGIRYALPVASAQLKSAVLLAGLYAEGQTTVTEPAPSRDHTERMLDAFGCPVARRGGEITVERCAGLRGRGIAVPGDISSAAFWLAAGLLVPDSEITLTGIGINPTRTGILDVIRAMGGDLTVDACGGDFEPAGDITVRASALRGCEIGGDIIPRLIDEIPILAVLAACAEGETVIRNAEELKVKETNRIAAVVTELSRTGADIRETGDGMVIRGGAPLRGADFRTYHDHRMAMACTVLALRCNSDSTLDNPGCAEVSYPGFFDTLEGLR